ncbi:cytochrome b-c1 complex subunit 2, mitochondrial [Neodiprion virginianus]|uniref:cytochrome b-c1 complex subunit 2, mitochondrial n=1 Tax=Neodiprion virginianus TaxID=2961670 RepID=UPI001EE6E832|nr:cytochrome b-c1 complex subunit 2, mitochondrial [Neodiprion virginianus]
MACSAVRAPLLRNTTVRHYAAAAAATQSAPAQNLDIQVLSNKITVATLDNDSPVTQVSVIFKAGPRNETYETQGTSHVLRLAAGLTTNRSSAFGITRNIQQIGGNLTATTDRESIAYTLQCTRDKLDVGLKFLEDVATRQVFKPWELNDQIPRLRYELSSIPETTRIVELLHKAAYRKGLGYSLYSPKQRIGKIGTENLQHFVNTWFTGPRCAVVATGVSQEQLNKFASQLQVGSSESSGEPARYFGGELRKERSSSLATVAVAVEGAGLNKEKEAIAFAILQRAAGTGPHVKWGSTSAPLYRTVATAAGKDPFAVSALNASYSDSGIFGFILTAPGNIAGTLTTAASKWLLKPSVTDADISRGKAELKAAVLYATDNSIARHESLAQQALFKGTVASPSAIIAEIEKVSAADVKNVAAKIGKGKLSMAGIGDLDTVPYVEELK